MEKYVVEINKIIRNKGKYYVYNKKNLNKYQKAKYEERLEHSYNNVLQNIYLS